mgnify:CR=1 FL=1
MDMVVQGEQTLHTAKQMAMPWINTVLGLCLHRGGGGGRRQGNVLLLKKQKEEEEVVNELE